MAAGGRKPPPDTRAPRKPRRAAAAAKPPGGASKAARKPAGAKAKAAGGSAATAQPALFALDDAQTASRPSARRPSAPGAGEAMEARPWALWAGLLVLGALALRLAIDASGLVPVHFDEAQYWAYGQELAWGYFSKPPLVGLLIRGATDLFGDTAFALRLWSALSHAGIAWTIFATGRRLWGGRTGFWAAAGYTMAPGVGVSALVMSTDPPMMLAWAAALYALVRAMEGGGRRWWVLVGVALGLGALAKYTMLTFAVGAIGYGLFSARGRDWQGGAIAGLVALAVLAPNLAWNAANGFATVAHVAEDADPGRGYLNPGAFAEFFGAQFGVIGPIFFAAILAAAWSRPAWRGDWAMRLMAWQTLGLLVPILILAFVTRAQPNWAAPAYVAGSLFAARWLLVAGWGRALAAQAGIGAAALAAVLALGTAFADGAGALPRVLDPFKKMRIGEPFCARALGAMAEEGAEVLLSDDRRRLSECMFAGGLGWDAIAVWNPELIARNHHEMVATLRPGDARPMLLAVIGDGRAIAARFAAASLIDEGRIRTHADREFGYALWLVEGFEGYETAY